MEQGVLYAQGDRKMGLVRGKGGAKSIPKRVKK
jgi:hypothetical protein